MAIRNNHWYNLNEQRYYPLDDVASAMSDQGQLLPSALIVDLRLRWPIELGKYAFLSAVSLTSQLVTVLIEVTDTLDNSPASSTLIAGVTLPRAELTLNRTYSLQSFHAGAGGFIVIGNDQLPPYSGRFSSPNQSLLTPRAARPSRRPPILSLGLENAATALTGLVNLVAVSPLKISRETRTISGKETDNVLVFSLFQPAAEIANVGGVARSVFSEFAGPCGKRVGSRTCGDPQPIESINGVQPDCNGVITLDFQGCATVGRNVVDCGVVVDCELGLSKSCDPPYLPNLQTGELPNETPPILIRPTLSPPPPVTPLVSFSESMTTVLTLPYFNHFDDQQADGFVALQDTWGFVNDEAPFDLWNHENRCSYGPLGPAAQAMTNISLWTLDVQTLFREYQVSFKIVSGLPGSRKNAGVVFNYRLNHLSSGTCANYHVVLLDVDTSTFGLYFFNGLSLVPLAEDFVPDARADEWWHMIVAIWPLQFQRDRVHITAHLQHQTLAGGAVASTISSNNYGADAGVAGLYTQQSESYFGFWSVAEVIIDWE